MADGFLFGSKTRRTRRHGAHGSQRVNPQNSVNSVVLRALRVLDRNALFLTRSRASPPRKLRRSSPKRLRREGGPPPLALAQRRSWRRGLRGFPAGPRLRESYGEARRSASGAKAAHPRSLSLSAAPDVAGFAVSLRGLASATAAAKLAEAPPARRRPTPTRLSLSASRSVSRGPLLLTRGASPPR